MSKYKFKFEPEPPAYDEGVLQQDYKKVRASLHADPSQATLVFGNLNTTLIHAASYDGEADIAELLIQLGADVNARETNGRTPLHHAAYNGHLDVIDVLVRNGADLVAKDNSGMTPLMWGKISRSGRKEQVVNKLLHYGAKQSDD
ncbi:MAG: ankyrin repeat domain-containing protein [Planctomycetes bacterium]|nr:ankyrin repeat domain-containing protein [Planctomycetota bacterium]